MKRLFVLLTLLMSTLWVSAQHQVRGTVRDEDGEPIPGASILLQGTSIGTISDIDGKYSLQASSKEGVLLVSFLGFTKQEIPIAGQSVIDVTLQSDVEVLEGVVVVGYGSERKSDLTGAVSSVKVEDNVMRQSATIDQVLQGRAAGVQVVGSGQPGAGVSVKIRGANSLRGNNEPLYVVDGVIVSSAGEDASVASYNGSIQSSQNGLTGINPRDIESIEVLKDASATAIYGSRGANGVILITTKKGEEGRAKINGYVTTSLTQVTKKLDVLNGVEYAQYQNEASVLSSVNPRYQIVDGQVYPVTYQGGNAVRGDLPLDALNWQDEVFTTGRDWNAGVSISGGDKSGSYYVSGGMTDNKGVFDNAAYRSADFRVNYTRKLTKNLKLDTRLNTFQAKGSFAQDGDGVGDANSSFVRTLTQYNPLIEEGLGFDDIDGLASPFSWINDFADESREARYVGRVALTYTLPVKGLSYELSAGGNIRNKDRDRWFGPTTWQGSLVNSQLTLGTLNSTSYQLNNLLKYNKYTKLHNINAVVGWTVDRRDVKNGIYEVNDFVTSSLRNEQPSYGRNVSSPLVFSYQPTKINSALGRATYSYSGKYVATATFRYDGVSKFQPRNRWSLFPSFALAWNASEESFIKNIGVFEELKLRAGWGQIGNHGIQPFQTFANFAPGSNDQYATPTNGTSVAFIQKNIANPDLRWETTEQWNVGVDFSVLDGRVSGTVDYYQKYTKDLLQQAVIPTSTGYSNRFTNLGQISNKGLEFMLNTVLVDNSDVTVKLGGNISFNRSKVEKLGLTAASFYENGRERQVPYYYGNLVSSGGYYKAPANVFMEGQPIGMFVGFETDGIYQSGDEILVKGKQAGDVKIIDQNGDGEIDEADRTIIGDPNPDFVYGLNLSADYKRFHLSALINGVYGNDIANGNALLLNYASGLNFNVSPEAFHSAWRPDRETNTQPRVGYDERNFVGVTDRIIEDGSYLRLGNITLGYDVPMDKIGGIGSLNVYIAARNLLTITNYGGYDPEVTSFLYDGSRIGVDWTTVPNTKSITLGANITF